MSASSVSQQRHKGPSAETASTEQQISYRDKFLPVQPELRNLYQGTEEAFLPALYDLVIRASDLGASHNHQCFELKQTSLVSQQEMGSNPAQLRILEFLVLLKQPRNILEIGTFIGLASMHLARFLPKGGKVTTIEKFEPFASVARENFKTNGLNNQIELLTGDALNLLKTGKIQGPFDFVFIDGNKENYETYFHIADSLLAEGGLIVIDDVLFHGDSLNPNPGSEKGRGVQQCLATVEANSTYHKLLLPLANGLHILLKKT